MLYDDDTSYLPPELIEPVHEPRDLGKVEELAEAMKEDGWRGRRLLVVECAAGRYRALSGSHRIAAAIEAQLERVPCYAIPKVRFDQADLDPDDAIDACTEDWQRMALVRRLKDNHAIQLMYLETSFTS